MSIRNFTVAAAVVASIGLGTWLTTPALRDDGALPPPAGVAGRTCTEVLDEARRAADEKRDARADELYTWLVEACEGLPIEPRVMLERAALLAYRAGHLVEARAIYREVLVRFRKAAEAEHAAFHLARIELDAGDLPQAIARLTRLIEQAPTSEHRESAALLAQRAGEMVARRRGPAQGARAMLPDLAAMLVGIGAVGVLGVLDGILARIGMRPDGLRALWSHRWAAFGAAVIVAFLAQAVRTAAEQRSHDELVRGLERLERLISERT